MTRLVLATCMESLLTVRGKSRSFPMFLDGASHYACPARVVNGNIAADRKEGEEWGRGRARHPRRTRRRWTWGYCWASGVGVPSTPVLPSLLLVPKDRIWPPAAAATPWRPLPVMLQLVM